jgi:hypothetical protein
MFANNLQSSSLRQAMTKTFDGQHPCCLCKAIAAGKQSEQKNQFTVDNLKLDFPPLEQGLVLIAPSRVELIPHEDAFPGSLSQKPLTPPPRSFFI